MIYFAELGFDLLCLIDRFDFWLVPLLRTPDQYFSWRIDTK